MFCKKCGNEINVNDTKCSNCGAKTRVNIPLLIGLVICFVVIITIVSVLMLGKKNSEKEKNNTLANQSSIQSEKDDNIDSTDKKGNDKEENTKEENIEKENTEKENTEKDSKDKSENKAESTSKNDTDLGLKFTKIDSHEINLTEEQKAVVEYFDGDYFEITNYEFLQRYPDVFEGTQVFTSGKVEKIICSDDGEYEILLWIGDSKDKYIYWLERSSVEYIEDYDLAYEQYIEENKNNYIVIKGEQSETRLIEGDFVTIRGRYSNINDYTIDGKSYHVLVVNCYRTLIGEYSTWEGAIDLYTDKEIRKIAKTIFKDVLIREPLEEEAFIFSNDFLLNPWYICELENKSNSKFDKYFFSRKMGIGKIVDYRSSKYPFKGKEENISREIQFASDFEHFYMFIYDRQLNFLTVEYYDSDLKKIWSREFEDTAVATYDYTKNNIYLVANNTLYIINTENGEDTYPPKFVGEKYGVRKLADSLILFAESQYDAIIKTDLSGEIIWKCNVDSDVRWIASPQVVEEQLIVNLCTVNEGEKYVVIDLNTGKMILNAKTYQ